MKETYTDEDLEIAISNHEKAIGFLQAADKAYCLDREIAEIQRRLSVLKGMRQSRRSG